MPKIASVAVVLLLALSGCSAVKPSRTVASCSGPMVQLNPEKWTATAEDLK